VSSGLVERRYVKPLKVSGTLVSNVRRKVLREVTFERYYSKGNPTEGFDWKRKLEKKMIMVDEDLERRLPIRRTHPQEGIRFRKRPWKKCKYYGRSLGPGTRDVPHCTDPSDPLSVECGWRKRLMPTMPRPNLNKIRGIKKFVRDFVHKWYKPLPRQDRDKNFEEWLNSSNYNGQRKSEMRRAYDSVYKEHKVLTNKDYWAKCFIKSEFYESPKHCRWINSRSDRFKSVVGPIIHKTEKIIYNTRINGHKWFVKGEDITQLPRKIKRVLKNKYKVETDFSSFESGFSPYFTDAVECELFRHMLKFNKPELDAVLKVYYQETKMKLAGVMQNVLIPRLERLVSRNYVAKVTGLRLSGEMWTSLGNGFSNFMIFQYEAKLKGANLIGLVEGDDGIFSCSIQLIQNAEIEQYGFRIKITYELEINKTCFCGNLFDQHEENLIIGPEQISRLMWTCQRKYMNCSERVCKELLKCKAMSLYVQGKHTPVAGWLAFKTQQLLKKYKSRYEGGNYWWDRTILELSKNEKFVEPKITMAARILYAVKFNIPISEQLEIEDSIQHATSVEDLFIDRNFMIYGDCCSNAASAVYKLVKDPDH